MLAFIACTVQADITSALVARYTFDNVATDSTANARNGTLVNSPAYGTGQISGCLNLVSASTQRCDIPSLVGVLGDDATFACWFKRTDATPSQASESGFAHLGAATSSGTTHMPWTNGLYYVGLFRATSNSSNSRVDGITPPGGVTRTNWHHICVTTTPGTNGWKLYVNGSLVSQTTGIAGVYYDADRWTVGASDDGANFHHANASFDDVRVYNRALSAGDVTELYNYTGIKTSLRYYYQQHSSLRKKPLSVLSPEFCANPRVEETNYQLAL